MAGTLYDAYLVQAQITGIDNTHTVVRAIEVYDAGLICAGNAAGGTIQVKKNGVNLTNAMTCAVANTVARADTLDGTVRQYIAGDTMNFVVANAAIGFVTVHCFVTGSGAAG